MENRIPIDDLFRDKLAQGREVPNLGAWANMSRMLDGQNPYEGSDESEPKKKRRILPFLGFLVALTSLISAGYYYVQTKQKSSKNPSAITQNQVISNDATSNSINSTNESSIDQNDTPQLEPQNNSNAVAINTNSNETINAETTFPENAPQASSNVEIKAKPKKNTKKSKKQITSLDIDANVIPNTKDIANAVQDQAISQSTFDTTPEIQSSKNNSKTSSIETKPKKPKTQWVKVKKLDTISQLKVSEQLVHQRNGEIKEIKRDTAILENVIREKEILKEVEITSLENQNIEAKLIPVEKSNPRWVALSKEEALMAEQKINLSETSTKQNQSIENKQVESINTVVNTPHLVQKSNKQTSYFQDMVAAAKSNFDKVANSKWNPFAGQIKHYPGMSAGVNAALINTKDNYGGFHLGLTDLIPINDYLSILTEIKMFLRNNSGFTVNDTETNIRNKNTDLTSLASQNQVIYQYAIDSNTKKYNFKSFTSLELPIMLQARKNQFGFYGGVNLAYNFGLDVTTIHNSFPSPGDVSDTLSKFEQYDFPTAKSYQYTRDDFRSRFGIGYTIGTSYDFNPNVYIDLRLSQTLWNNAKTEAAKQVSNGVFKVPFFQFSVGYRFKKFEANKN